MTGRPHRDGPITSVGVGFEVRLDKVTFHPPSSHVPILKEISLRIESGEFVALCGLNGAGKSSLLRLVAGDLSTSERRGLVGTVTVAKQAVTGPINTVINGVGVVHQNDRRDLVGGLSVAQNIAIRQMLGGGHRPRLVGAPAGWRREIAMRLSDICPGAAVDIRQEVDTLSGGQRQMLSVAIAVHLEHENNPCRLLLLDEHTARLDHVNAGAVMRFTTEQIRATGSTAIMATHQYSDAIQCASRILVIRERAVAHDIRNPASIDEVHLAKLVSGAA